ncbi:hypothetical protein BLA6863_03314 [Burkholderia lata]|uniref:Uncharacterized protein n=1 Tax=Burkholderia lata (strain ATCC 17760 / DSM 23089 / LMG 22485 / NCIMB 9086 / R18194 / 383) TaxID=482957 RepID=A0A6P2LUR4_BURL3|nr:hypothetical protein BLA6863_03314 [Burkholderia lata]
MQNSTAGWLDWKVNVQTLVTGVLGAAIALTVAYFTLVGRVSKLEDHVAAIEVAAANQKQDVREALNEIKASVKDTNSKVDRLNEQLFVSSAGARPETRRWSKP